uniref:Uncharacterized protein n=1 Tax=Anguilla anguilla TaxID=7936 RepID=A0A0E9TZ30_ANGAN
MAGQCIKGCYFCMVIPKCIKIPLNKTLESAL